jgi:hypothetical protein
VSRIDDRQDCENDLRAENSRLRAIEAASHKVRICQKAYFAGRKGPDATSLLIASKEAEKELDRLLAEVAE